MHRFLPLALTLAIAGCSPIRKQKNRSKPLSPPLPWQPRLGAPDPTIIDIVDPEMHIKCFYRSYTRDPKPAGVEYRKQCFCCNRDGKGTPPPENGK
jgi:hypothetical protein